MRTVPHRAHWLEERDVQRVRGANIEPGDLISGGDLAIDGVTNGIHQTLDLLRTQIDGYERDWPMLR
jgi:hypothetical protein